MLSEKVAFLANCGAADCAFAPTHSHYMRYYGLSVDRKVVVKTFTST
jgi:hypothetical protein